MLPRADQPEPGLATDERGEVDACLSHNGRSTAPLDVSTSVDPSGAPLLGVRGEIDLSNVTVLESAIASATAERPRRLVIDMSQVTFIGSTGVRALIEASERAGSVCLRAPSRATRQVLELIGLPNSSISIES